MASKKVLDDSGLLYVWQKIGGKFVEKQTGKVLSDNNLTDALKAAYDAAVLKVAGIEAGAEVNIIEQIKLNGTALSPDGNRAVNIEITQPTKTSDLTNDSDFQTGTQVTTAINEAIAGISGIEFVVVQTLPQSGESGVIYLVPNGESAGTDIYDEYIWYSNRYEKIGSTNIDLSDYWNTSNLVSITNNEIDTICT